MIAKTSIDFDETVHAPARTRQQGAGVNVAAADRRLLELFQAMSRERWLPIGLRTMIVHDLPTLRRSLECPRPKVGAMRRCLHDISDAAREYGRAVAASETILLVRALEYELSALDVAA